MLLHKSDRRIKVCYVNPHHRGHCSPAMYSRFCLQYTLLAVLVSITHGMIMVETVDGSFVPWGGLQRRAPGDVIPVRLANNEDLAYLVSFYSLPSGS
jgi:hypothetical protein